MKSHKEELGLSLNLVDLSPLTPIMRSKAGGTCGYTSCGCPSGGQCGSNKCGCPPVV